MQIKDLLPRNHVYVPVEGPTLRDALKRMVTDLGQRGVLRAPDELTARIDSEPMRDSVAVSSRVVVPRYRTPHVDGVVFALGIAAEPLNAKEAGLDARPRIVALVLAPPDEPGTFLRTVASLERLLHQDDVVEQIVAGTTADDVLRVKPLAELHVQHGLTARDIMTSRVDAVPPETPVREAVRLLVRNRAPAVPVVGAKGEVLGLVTDRDVMRALLPLPKGEDADLVDRPRDLTVREIMARSVLCISEELAIEEILTTMVNKQLDVLPVVRAGALAGMVTRGEIVRKLFGP